ncbi:hypothetical protein Tco_0448092 [Tanacetum coccineum]
MDNTRAPMSSVMKNFEIRLSKVTAFFSNSPKEENEKGRNPYPIVAHLEGRESMAVGLVPSHGAKMANGARLHGSRHGLHDSMARAMGTFAWWLRPTPKLKGSKNRRTFFCASKAKILVGTTIQMCNIYLEAKKKGFTERTSGLVDGGDECVDDHMSRLVAQLYDSQRGGKSLDTQSQNDVLERESEDRGVDSNLTRIDAEGTACVQIDTRGMDAGRRRYHQRPKKARIRAGLSTTSKTSRACQIYDF